MVLSRCQKLEQCCVYFFRCFILYPVAAIDYAHLAVRGVDILLNVSNRSRQNGKVLLPVDKSCRHSNASVGSRHRLALRRLLVFRGSAGWSRRDQLPHICPIIVDGASQCSGPSQCFFVLRYVGAVESALSRNILLE